MPYTLGQAAKMVGRSKPTIARAIRSGKLSASRTETGAFAIDESELHRVFQVSGNGAGTMLRAVPGEADGTSQATLRVERDRLLAEREDLRETIRDLRHRLDSEVEERRRLLALLTDQRRPWWRRWFR
jgi:excisionase family DNA binding protein